MFFRLLALLVLLSSFTYSQTPSAPAPNPQPADPKVPLFPTDLAGTPYSESAVQKIGHGISAPVPMKTPQAKYTREARERKVQGVCFVSLIVDANGVPQNPRIVRPVGYGLDAAALDAIRKYRFKPAMKDKKPVPVMMTIEVNFRLY